MNILLLGSNGQLGWALQRALSPLGTVLAYTRTQADITRIAKILNLINMVKPDVIVNVAAYTDVDQAEEFSTKARMVNAEAVEGLAKICQRHRIRLVHYSTDYVFDGKKKDPYIETDEVCPLNIYGETKAEGEEAIRSSGCKYLLFRTSWVYSPHGNNFLRTILRLASTEDTVRVVSDQLSVPTSSALLADVTALCLYRLDIDKGMAEWADGLYHLVPHGQTTWYQYARVILDCAEALHYPLRVRAKDLIPISTDQSETSAVRPLYSCMNTSKFRSTFGLKLPEWETGVRQAVTTWIRMQPPKFAGKSIRVKGQAIPKRSAVSAKSR